MTQAPDKAMEMLANRGRFPSGGPVPWDVCISVIREALDAQEAENRRLRETLAQIDYEATNTIPPDGKDAAFAALHRIALLINPFRLPAATSEDQPCK